MKRVLALVILITPYFSSFAQATQSRLTATATSNYNGSKFYLIDSVNYSYFYSYVGGDLTSKYIPYYDAISYKLDTNTGTNLKVRKSMQQFDGKYHRTTTTDYLWSGMWRESNQTLYSPDAYDSTLSNISQMWNPSKLSWDNNSKQDFTYNASHSRTSYILSFWNAVSGSWIGNEQFLYSYDATNRLIKSTYQKWNAATSSWENSVIDSFDYSLTGQVISDIVKLWDKSLSEWKNFKQTIYIYDAHDFLIAATSSAWDAALSIWVNGQRELYVNNTKGDILEQETQNWNSTLSIWENFAKRIFAYDSRENVISDISQIWDTGSGAYTNRQQYQNTFDPNNNLIREIARVWDMTSADWINNELDSFSYNHFNQLTYFTYFTRWDDAGSFWYHNVEDQELRYYYEDYTTSIAESKATGLDLILYPVPARTTLNINLKGVNGQSLICRIIDLQGHVLKQWSVAPVNTYYETISIEALQSGNYFIEFVGNKDGLLSRQFRVN